MDVTSTLYGLANGFDLKAWDRLGSYLAEHIECDYRDLRGTLETYSREQYIELRIKALGHLKTQHLFSNLCIEVQQDTAQCQLSALILRRNDEGVAFDTHAIYDYGLVCVDQAWQVNRIKQTVLWNDGDASIHAGAV